MIVSGCKVKRFVSMLLRLRCPLSVHVEKIEEQLALWAWSSGARCGLETEICKSLKSWD